MSRELKKKRAQAIVLNGELAGLVKHQQEMLAAGQSARIEAATVAARWVEEEQAADEAFVRAEAAFDAAVDRSRSQVVVAEELRRLATVRVRLLALEYAAAAHLLGISTAAAQPRTLRVLRARLEERLGELPGETDGGPVAGALWGEEALWARVRSEVGSWQVQTGLSSRQLPQGAAGVRSALKAALLEHSPRWTAADSAPNLTIALKSCTALSRGELEYSPSHKPFLVRFPGALLSFQELLHLTKR
ncbi:MAG: hypothetical protein GKR94_08810 [Gammaproteobacteria bacterium]|nr:hypothetical protein [Gammaproteobacteria bacterium]